MYLCVFFPLGDSGERLFTILCVVLHILFCLYMRLYASFSLGYSARRSFNVVNVIDRFLIITARKLI